jgi:aspartate-semialdehyde dehydrogenase
MNKIKTAVLGCTGLVGRQFIRLLMNHPYFELSCLTASPRSAGREVIAGLPVRETTVPGITQSGARVVFSALPAGIAAELEMELRNCGLAVFSNAGAHRMDASVPLLIPEVNAPHLELIREQLREAAGFIVTNPNCVVSGLALALKPLTAFALRAVTVTTFQAVSGGGRRGVGAWDILGNIIPFIANEEEKIVRETRKILGTISAARVNDHGLEILASCSRVPVRDGHLQSVTVEFAGAVKAGDIAAAWSGFSGEPQRLALPTAPLRPLLVHESADRPQPRLDVDAGEPERARGMAVSVGRLRVQGKRCGFFLLVNNTVRGAAGGSVLNAELAFRQHLLPEASHG